MTGPLRGRGFALVAVLWVIVGAGALALTARLLARELVGTARARTEYARARWQAEGCAARARAVIDRSLRRGRAEGAAGGAWSTLPALLDGSDLVRGCDLRLHAVGATLDLNAADAETLRRLFLATGAGGGRADSLVDAVLDWRDADQQPRPLGAEREAYRRAGAMPPRNGPFADVRELRRVRGLAGIAGLDTLLGVEPGPVALNHAPAAVLLALSGMTREAADRLLELRARGERVDELAALAGRLSPAAQAELLGSLPSLSGATVAQPIGWILLSRGRSGQPPASAVLELKLVRAAGHAVIIRTRTWVE